ncbi:MAG TPA: endonuclease/exonuclease/phosphatase family protein, partial [Limnochordia bacterium]|nr:endonuclease/exonuclease/phosphatase family protein [Limnochordia bacterium]
MRVLSFNLRNANAKDGPNAWDERTEAVADVWRAIDADLAGIQEGYLRQVRFLEERFPGYLRLGVGRDGGENGEHSAIFVRRDRFRVLAHGDFWLSDTPEVPASKHWGNNCVRMATWAHLRDHEGGELLYLNTHLDHEAPQARVKGAELICSFLAERSGDRPVVVTGDFNERPEGETVRTFL